MREWFLKILQDRFSCKLFDETKVISKEDFEYILEAGRLSPSSLGLEPWKFIVVRDKQKREELKKACWNQPQITTASEVVVILARIAELHPDHEYVKERLFALREKNSEVYPKMLEFYKNYYLTLDIVRYSSEQCHLAAMNMMNAARAIGIDSCPIGGLVEKDVKEVLAIKDDYAVSLVLAFGYCAKAGRIKDRLPLEKIIEYV